tara:strand:- start:614 stop:1210 length:597 start_codon:yes stop_codon:yes gene_type:complete
MSTLEVNTINPQSGNDVTIGGSSKNVKFASGTTVDFNTNTPTLTLGAAMKATPAFEARGSAEQTGVSDNTWTKVSMNTEIFDTDSMYDASTNYRFTPTTAGKYYVYAMMSLYGGTSDQLQIANLGIYKNGSNYKYLSNNFNNSYPHNEAALFLSTVVDMNGSSDYVELYGRANVLSGNVTFEPQNTLGLFGAYRIIGA